MLSKLAENVPLFFLVSCASVLLFVAVAHPVTNVLVRFRADYTPRRILLAAEDGVEPSVPSRTGVTSIFGIIGRIWRIEGFQGFFKGYVPTASISIAALVAAVLFVGVEGVQPGGSPDWPSLSPWQNAVVCFVGTLFNIPVMVITYRAIVTPQRLGWFNIAQGYRALLSPTEQRRPWSILFTPGLFSAGFLHMALYMYGVLPLRRVLLGPGASQDQLSLFLVTIFVGTLISTPLEVVETRLAIQRNHKGAVPPEPVDSAREDVISYRAEDDPYKGLLDTAERIGREEGWYILYRAWWFTFLGNFSFFAA